MDVMPRFSTRKDRVPSVSSKMCAQGPHGIRIQNSSAQTKKMMSFPNTRSVLWDQRPQGKPTTIHLSEYRNPLLILEEKTLWLMQRFATQDSSSDTYHCWLLGSISSDPDGEGVRIIIDRIDPNPNADEEPMPGELRVPCILKKNAVQVTSTSIEEYSKDLEFLYQRILSKDRIDLGRFISARVHCSYHINQQNNIFYVDVDLVTLGTAFSATPVKSVPIVPTALSKNLSGPLSLSELQGEAKTGYLTMDHTRKLVLVLESDPKVNTLPIIGIWLSGIHSIHDPFAWASCLRYLYNSALQDRVCIPPEAFLVVLYSPLHSQPEFYNCCTADSKMSVTYALSSCYEIISLPKESPPRPRSPLEVELLHAECGSKLEKFESALQENQSLMTVSNRKTNISSSLSASQEEIVPRSSPAPHLSKAFLSMVQPAVPEVSLLLDEQETKSVPQPHPYSNMGQRLPAPQPPYPTAFREKKIKKASDQDQNYTRGPLKPINGVPPGSMQRAPYASYPAGHSITPTSHPNNSIPGSYSRPLIQPQKAVQWGTVPVQNNTYPPYSNYPVANGLIFPGQSPAGSPSVAANCGTYPQPHPQSHYTSPQMQPALGQNGPAPLLSNAYMIPAISTGAQHGGPRPQAQPSSQEIQHAQFINTQHVPVMPANYRGPTTAMNQSPNPALQTVGQSTCPPTSSSSSVAHLTNYQMALPYISGDPSHSQPQLPVVSQLSPNHIPISQAPSTMSLTSSKSVTQTPVGLNSSHVHTGVPQQQQRQGNQHGIQQDRPKQQEQQFNQNQQQSSSLEIAEDTTHPVGSRSDGGINVHNDSNVPPQVYELLKEQDSQLKALREQLQQLLLKQSEKVELPVKASIQLASTATQSSASGSPVRTGIRKNMCEMAVNTSLWWPQANTSSQDGSATLHTTHSSTGIGAEVPSGQQTMINTRDNSRSKRADTSRDIHDGSSLNHSSGPELQTTAGSSQDHNQSRHSEAQTTAQEQSPNRTDVIDQSLSSLSELQLGNIHDRTEESYISMVVDMPGYPSLSPEKSPHGGSSGFGDNDESNRSPILGESVSMYECMNDSLGPAAHAINQSEDTGLGDSHPQVSLLFRNQHEFYNNLLGNVQKFLRRHSGEDQETPEEYNDAMCESLQKGDSPPLRRPSEDKSIDVAGQTRRQLQKMGINLDDLDQNEKVFRNDNHTILFDPKILPKIQYVSLMLDSDSDLSADADSLAIKYLSDEQLAELAKTRLSTPGRRNRHQYDPALDRLTSRGHNEESTINGHASNHLSFASKKYMERYGLFGEGTEVATTTETRTPQTPAVPHTSLPEQSSESSIDPAILNAKAFLQRLKDNSLLQGSANVPAQVANSASADCLDKLEDRNFPGESDQHSVTSDTTAYYSPNHTPHHHHHHHRHRFHAGSRHGSSHSMDSTHSAPNTPCGHVSSAEGDTSIKGVDLETSGNSQLADSKQGSGKRILDIKRLKELPKLL